MKITHAQRGSTGRLFGVDFVDGVGYSEDPRALERLAAQGHKIEPDDADTADPGSGDQLGDLTVAELRRYAQEHDVDLAGAKRRADILAAIENR